MENQVSRINVSIFTVTSQEIIMNSIDIIRVKVIVTVSAYMFIIIIAITGQFVDLPQMPGLHTGRTETKQALHRVASIIYACPGASPEVARCPQLYAWPEPYT